MRGQRPKPTRIREAEGNAGKRRLNRSEPTFQAVKPTAPPPDWLNDAAKAEWARVAPHLSRLGLLQVVDTMSLGAYCSAVAHWQEAERAIQEHGSTLTLRDDKGVVRAVTQSPHVGAALKWLDKIRQFSAEFGFSPSARGRIEIDKSNLKGAEAELDLEAVRRELEDLTGTEGDDETVQ